MRSLKGRLMQRGESVIAALVIAGVAGGVLLAFLYFAGPPQPTLSQAAAGYVAPSYAPGGIMTQAPVQTAGPATAQPATAPTPSPAAPAASAPSTNGATDDQRSKAAQAECVAGQVHTVREVSEQVKVTVPASSQAATPGTPQPQTQTKTETKTAERPSDTIVTCWQPETSTAKKMVRTTDPKVLNDPESVAACKVSDLSKCVVRYCPITAANPKGDCYVITCKSGAKDCLRDKLGSLLTGNSAVEKLADLRYKQPGYEVVNGVHLPSDQSDVTVQSANGTTSSDPNAVKNSLDPNAWTALRINEQISENESKLQTLDSQFNACSSGLSSWIPSTCGETAQNNMSSEYQRLVDENESLQKGFDDNMQKLASDQGSITTGGGRPACDPYTTTCGNAPPAPDPGCGPGQVFVFNKCTTCDTSGSCTTTPPPGATPPPASPPPPDHNPVPPPYPAPASNGSGLGNLVNAATRSGLFYQMGYMLGSLLRNDNNSGSNTTNANVANIACAKNADQYNSQIRQYNDMVQQFNQRLQQMQYQCQQNPYGYGGNPYGGYGSPNGYGGYGNDQYGYGGSYGFSYGTAPVGYAGGGYGSCAPGSITSIQKPPQPPQPCYDNAHPSMCQSSPPAPQGQQCQGTWKPLTASQNGCITGWQCIPTTATSTASSVAAQISCQPQVADIGMTVAISFGCQNAAGSTGAGFDTHGLLAGSASTSIPTDVKSGTSVSYGVTCAGPLGVASAQCSIQVAKPSAVLVADPGTIHKGGRSTIGWISSGMQSCVVSNPDLPDFTEANADNNDVNGAVQTPALATSTTFYLRCVSLSGNPDEERASVTVN